MKRSWSALVVVAVVALALGACDQSTGPTVQYSSPGYHGCRQFTSCQTCTPVLGCGWCYLPDGTGRCASDPDECSGATGFTWEWNPEGCYVAPDASVNPVPHAEAGAGEASASPPDAGASAVDSGAAPSADGAGSEAGPAPSDAGGAGDGAAGAEAGDAGATGDAADDSAEASASPEAGPPANN